MLFKVKRLSNYGSLFPKPCEGAVPVGVVDTRGLASSWEINLDDIRDLAAAEGKLIIQKDGTVVIYDDYYE